MGQLAKRFPHYSKLLRLYPAAYRKEYDEQMLQTLADMLDDPARSHTTTWAQTVLDFPVSVVHQQITYTGAAMKQNEHYLTRTAQFGAWLVAPFFVFIIINGINDHLLRHSVLWHTNFLVIWLILLPSLAILFTASALLRWLRAERRATHQSILHLLTKQFRRIWPLLGVMFLGFAILATVFFHDSVRCVAGNPVRELRNARATLRCIENR